MVVVIVTGYHGDKTWKMTVFKCNLLMPFFRVQFNLLFMNNFTEKTYSNFTESLADY